MFDQPENNSKDIPRHKQRNYNILCGYWATKLYFQL